MAKSSVNIDSQCNTIVSEVRKGIFKPVYLLMGDEPYYPNLVCKAIIDNCIQEDEKDFNEMVCYGGDVTAEQIITSARRFPMMSERQLVVVKEAQQLARIDELAFYCKEPLDSTVLVILLHGASLDKRTALYKTIQKIGTVVDSPTIRDYEITDWIISFYGRNGLQINPQAAALLGESAGTDLSTIVSETDKLKKLLPQGTTSVTVEDIEKNVGIQRQFSIFELTKELSYGNAAKALKIASHLGTSARFSLPMATSALFNHYSRILKYGTVLAQGNTSSDQKSRALAGVNPYFYKEYDAAVRRCPPRSAMAAISLLCEFDYRGKGGDGGSVPTDELLMELTARLLNI